MHIPAHTLTHRESRRTCVLDDFSSIKYKTRQVHMLRASLPRSFHHPQSLIGHQLRQKADFANHHEAHAALGTALYADADKSSESAAVSYTAATKGRILSEHPNKANQRPAPPHKLPMLMNVAKACPVGWGGSALCPNTKKFDGVRIVAAAYRAHERILLKKLESNKRRQQQQQQRASDDDETVNSNNNSSSGSGEKNNYLYYDDEVFVVPDRYPKSTFHFLVIPRISPSTLMSIAEAKQDPGHIALLRRMDAVCAEMVKALFVTPTIEFGSPKQLEYILRLGREAEGIKIDEGADQCDEDEEDDISDFNAVPQTMLRQWLMRPRSMERMKQYQERQLQQQQQQLLESSSRSSQSGGDGLDLSVSSSTASTNVPAITKLKFMSGFHALPSLCPLHMHITSLDLVSDCLKNKKHYNSFTTAFFLSRSFVVAQLGQFGYVKLARDPASREHCEKLENQGLKCVWCGMPHKSVPELKDHLLNCSKNACYFV